MAEQNPKASNESNPIGEELMVEVSIPEKIEIKMVDASSLNDFELWSLLASIFCNFFVGFLVAAISNTEEKRVCLYWSVTGIFLAFSIFFIIMMVIKRKKMSIKTKCLQLGVNKSEQRR